MGNWKCLQTDPSPPRGREPLGNALGSIGSDKTGEGKEPKGGVCGGWGQRTRDTLGSVPGANSSPRICGVNDESRARLLLEDLGDPALETGTRSGGVLIQFGPMGHGVTHPRPSRRARSPGPQCPPLPDSGDSTPPTPSPIRPQGPWSPGPQQPLPLSDPRIWVSSTLLSGNQEARP